MSANLLRARLVHSLGQVDGLLAAPYGYTVSLWTAGAAASAHFGLPTPAEILLFAAGAVAAFLTLAWWGRHSIDAEVPGHVPVIVVANGVALVAAVAVSLLCALVPWPLLGFGLSGFGVTLTYGVSLAAFLAFAPQALRRRKETPITAPPRQDPVWLFDLDNTLYPANTGLMDALDARIDEFITRRLRLPPAVAEAVREAYYGRYGSSIGGVLRHCQVDAGELLDYAHDLPLEQFLQPDSRLAKLLAGLPGHKYVFTNAPLSYARRALRALGVEHYFDHIFDIHFAGLEGKPAATAYEKVLHALGQPAGACWLVEDSLANLLPAKALRCRTVWLAPNGTQEAPPYVEHTIHDLGELLHIAHDKKEDGP